MRYPARERRRISVIRRRHAELCEPLAFLERLAELAASHVDKGAEPPPTPDSSNGTPPLAPHTFPLDLDAAAAAFRAVLEALAETTGSPAADGALAALDEGRLDPRSLVRAWSAGDRTAFDRSAAAADGLDRGLLFDVAELAVKPQFVAAALRLERRPGGEGVRPGRCPACGSAPEMAVITDGPDAEAVLLAVCRLCETEWQVQRVRCLGCGNEDDDTLGYLRAEYDERVRINLCERCRRYLPVVDARGRLEIAPAVERATATHLEILAVARGYEPLATAEDTATRQGTVGGVPPAST
jgi:FdhE protein